LGNSWAWLCALGSGHVLMARVVHNIIWSPVLLLCNNTIVSLLCVRLLPAIFAYGWLLVEFFLLLVPVICNIIYTVTPCAIL
jgi:hypothetical protein